MTMLKDSSTAPHATLTVGARGGTLTPADELFAASDELFAASRPGDHQGQQAPELTTVLHIMERIFKLV